MKIIQFVHPMFLTALGLHASLLFVPIGGEADPELIEEDVPLAELTEDASSAATLPTPERLPVPDLNVTRANTNSTTAKPDAAKPSAASPAVIAQSRPVPIPAPIRVAAPTPTAAQPAQLSPAGAQSASGTESSSAPSDNSPSASSVADAIRSAVNDTARDGSNSGASVSSTGTPTSDSEASEQPVSEQPISFIPDLSVSEAAADDEVSNTETNSDAGSSRAGIANESVAIPVENARLSALIAALPSETVVPNALEESVLALQKALLYRQKETTDERAEQMREAWTSSVSRELGAIERLALTAEEDWVLAYPIASSMLREGRSLDVCLDAEPSNVEVGVVLDADGKLTVEPEILRSTGYEALDMEAIAMVKDESMLQSISAAAAQENLTQQSYLLGISLEIETDYDKDACIDP